MPIFDRIKFIRCHKSLLYFKMIQIISMLLKMYENKM